MSEFPLQTAKVQRPALRVETLQRDRLLDWLTAQEQSRVILISAEAGYGKTTLLADFSRRTRRRVLWFRIDEGDRSWVSLVRYLLAAGQELDPEFGLETGRLIERLGSPESPIRDEIVASLIRDFSVLGLGGGALLILDDYHQIDDVAEIREILNEFVARAPERLTIVIAGRRPPSLALARLRSIGAVAELRTDDLRFDVTESERLFRVTYGRALDQDVLADLTRRIDGWAACLQLVQAALRDRSTAEIREFVADLSGATGDLHDYLAEEVVGDLDPPIQRFLMRASLLQSIYPKLAAVVGEVNDLDAGRLVAETERIGLLSRRSDAPAGGRRFHPLVKEFLEARLRREAGEDEIIRLHRLIAIHARATDWRLAAHHFAAAGDIDDLHALVEASLPSIMAAGDFAIAESFIDRMPDGRTWPIFDIVLSRMELHRGRPTDAVRLAETAVAGLGSSPGSPILDQALANLTSVYYQAGLLKKARETATNLYRDGPNGQFANIAKATADVIDSSIDGSLTAPVDVLYSMATQQQAGGDLHYFGITQLNIGEFERARGNPNAALVAANEAVGALSASSASHEVPAARLIKAWAQAHLNEMEGALSEVETALNSEFRLVRDEVRIEAASILLTYADAAKARAVLARVGNLEALAPDVLDQYAVSMAELDITDGLYENARSRLDRLAIDEPHREPGFKARVMTLRAISAALCADPRATDLLEAALHQAMLQGAGRWGTEAAIALRLVRPEGDLEELVLTRDDAIEPWLSAIAELVLTRNESASPAVDRLVAESALSRPSRWRPALRRSMGAGSRASRTIAANLLELVGEAQDVPLLIAFAHEARLGQGARFGRDLARRVASPIHVADLGRVGIQIGDRVVEGESVRRKVLALLCFLITRPNMSAARDQVVDALWPDQDPAAASNSLNQTVYFLRRSSSPNTPRINRPGT